MGIPHSTHTRTIHSIRHANIRCYRCLGAITDSQAHLPTTAPSIGLMQGSSDTCNAYVLGSQFERTILQEVACRSAILWSSASASWSWRCFVCSMVRRLSGMRAKISSTMTVVPTWMQINKHPANAAARESRPERHHYTQRRSQPPAFRGVRLWSQGAGLRVQL